MRPVLMGLLLFILLFISLDILNASYKIGLSFSEVSLFIYGNEEEYIDPISFASLLEYVHLSIFLSMMLLLTLSAIYARLCTSHKRVKKVINLLMISAIISIISLLSAPYTQLGVYCYVISFWIYHASVVFMSVVSLKKLL